VEVMAFVTNGSRRTFMASSVKISIVILFTLVAKRAFVTGCTFVVADAIVQTTDLVAFDECVRLI